MANALPSPWQAAQTSASRKPTPMETAIATAERETEGELVVMVVQASDAQDIPAESSHGEEAKPIRLWGAGGKIATPLEEDLEQVMGEKL